MDRVQSYGDNKKSADYLESFNDFIKEQINLPTTLSVVVNKPKNLTRKELKEVRLLLDQHGYSRSQFKICVA